MLTSDPTNAEAVVAEVVAQFGQLSDRSNDCVRALRRQFSRHLVKADAKVVVEIARRLVAKGAFHRFIAYELISQHKKALGSLRRDDLVELANNLNSWEAVDTFALYLAGPCWREAQVPIGVIEDWANSKDRWWRRTALVCTVALNNKTRGGSGDVQRTLRICRMLVSDRDDMVVKAQSWALRELAKRDAQAVRRFLGEHENALASRVVREVRNKLATGLKNPRRTV